jgi:hypothetical protein
MKPTEPELELELEEEFVDFTWEMVQWWAGADGEFHDGIKLPAPIINEMRKSLKGER